MYIYEYIYIYIYVYIDTAIRTNESMGERKKKKKIENRQIHFVFSFARFSVEHGERKAGYLIE